MARRSFFGGSPMLNEERMQKASEEAMNGDMANVSGARMTVSGAVNKSIILALIMLATAVVGYSMPNPILIWGGAIAGFIIVMVASYKPHLSHILAPIYAALEGLFVGGVSAIYAAAFSGIIFQAVTLTMAVLFMMLFLYKMQIIKVTEKLRAGVFMATGAIALVYIVNIALSFFGINMPYLHEGGMIGIGISLVIIGVAAMNLLLDFDTFDKGEQYGAPAYMEWFSAMGLLITLVWLYIEILRLISILSRE